MLAGSKHQLPIVIIPPCLYILSFGLSYMTYMRLFLGYKRSLQLYGIALVYINLIKTV